MAITAKTIFVSLVKSSAKLVSPNLSARHVALDTGLVAPSACPSAHSLASTAYFQTPLPAEAVMVHTFSRALLAYKTSPAMLTLLASFAPGIIIYQKIPCVKIATSMTVLDASKREMKTIVRSVLPAMPCYLLGIALPALHHV